MVAMSYGGGVVMTISQLDSDHERSSNTVQARTHGVKISSSMQKTLRIITQPTKLVCV